MLLSIIIPVYNVERYIVETLESILSQNTFPFTYEVIVVNDGTPDHSMEIVERYRYSFDNLTIINQENQGLSCARNSGLKIAKGDYVWFIDSDDSIPQDAFESLFPYLTRYRHEVLAFDITKIEEETGKKLTEKIFLKPKYYHLYNTSHNGTELNKKIHTGIVQRFIFCKSFLSRCHLAFTPGIIHEDIDFIVRILLHANSILPIAKPCYNYLLRSTGSIMSSLNIKSCTDRIKIIKLWNKIESEEHLSKMQKAVIEDNIFNICYGLFISSPRNASSYEQFLRQNRNYIIRRGLTAALYSIFSYFSLGKVAKTSYLLINLLKK